MLIILAATVFHLGRMRVLEGETRYLTLFRQSSAATVRVGPDTEILDFNDAWADLLGYSASELAQMTIDDATHPDDREASRQNFRRLFAGEIESYRSEKRYIRKDGGTRWGDVSTSAISDSKGKVIGAIGTVLDITERKIAESSLREKTELIQLLHRVATAANEATDIDSATLVCLETVCKFYDWPVGHLYLLDEETEMLVPTAIWYQEDPAATEAFRKDTEKTRFNIGDGLPGETIQSGQPESIVDIKAFPNFYRSVSAAAAGLASAIAIPVKVRGKPVAVLEFYLKRVYRPDGSEMAILLQIAAQLAQVMERLEAASSLEAAKTDAETANRAKSEFLSSMSHELRTPLNAILGFGQMLEYNPKEPLTESQSDCVEHILGGGKHLLELINEVLDLARIEAGKVEMSFEDISFMSVYEECQSLIEPMAAHKRIDIVTADGSGHETAFLHADFTRLKQALLNLMSNAVKYNRDGGTVTLDVRDTGEGLVRISITDTGPGIPKRSLKEIFQPFKRLGAESTKVEGTGIGLTITKQLVEMMNGEIGCESTLGEGSTFWITLPAADCRSEDGADISDSAAANSNKIIPAIAEGEKLILYVEDNPANLELMELIIDRAPNLKLVSALNGEIGIELARVHKPDVILMDINLPGIDGYEAMARLRANRLTKNIPIIALSAMAKRKDIEEGEAAGFFSYLTKPIVIEETLQSIKDALNRAAT